MLIAHWSKVDKRHAVRVGVVFLRGNSERQARLNYSSGTRYRDEASSGLSDEVKHLRTFMFASEQRCQWDRQGRDHVDLATTRRGRPTGSSDERGPLLQGQTQSVDQ